MMAVSELGIQWLFNHSVSILESVLIPRWGDSEHVPTHTYNYINSQKKVPLGAVCFLLLLCLPFLHTVSFLSTMQHNQSLQQITRQSQVCVGQWFKERKHN